MKKFAKNLSIYLVIFALVLAAAFAYKGGGNAEYKQVKFSTLVSYLEKEQVSEIKIEDSKITAKLGTDKYVYTYAANITDIDWLTSDYIIPQVAHRYQSNPSGIQKDVMKIIRCATGLETTGKKRTAHRVRNPNRYSLHSFRHTFVSFCANAGVPLDVVASIVGHGSTAMTRHYAHISDEAKGKAIGALPVLESAQEEVHDPDRELLLKQLSGLSTEELATGVTGYVTYGILPGETAASFMWSSDNCLITSNGTTVPAVGITQEYAVTNDRIYYSASAEAGSHLTTVLYDGTTWSTPVTLTGGERYLENLNVVTFNGADCLLGMDTLATILSEDVIDAKNLVWAIVMPSSDLRLESITYNADGLSPGDTVPVTLHVTNAGDHTVESLTVECEGMRQMVACSIKPGETLETNWELACSDALTSYSFSVYETEMDDFTPDDNTAAVSIGYADLAVELTERKIGAYQALEAFLDEEL